MQDERINRFKLSMFYSFAQPLVSALGYGNVMHEIVKNIHKAAIAGETIDKEDGIKVNGRIDLVKKKNVDGVHKTYIVDFKTANKEVRESINKEQLKIYALGYQELTGTKADYMEVYQLDSENRARESIMDSMMEEVRTDIKDKKYGGIKKNGER